MRVVLYAEGAGELLGSITQLPPVATSLKDDFLGPAHLLLRRAMMEAWSAPSAAIAFESPKRFRGRLACGSDLHNERSLCELLSWFQPMQKPELAMVLVDADGDKQRQTRLQRATDGVSVPIIITVAVQEFEAWLISDHRAVRAVLNVEGGLSGATNDPESLDRKKAKELLALWLEQAGVITPEEQRLRRAKIAAESSLEVIANSCRSFADLLKQLKAITPKT